MNDTQSIPRPYFRTPSISPDGARIAFVYAADIWLVGIEGGDAERLTAHSSHHASPRWSPDGKRIAFSSSRTGLGDIYVLPLQPSSGPDESAGDGQTIVFERDFRIWRFDMSSNSFYDPTFRGLDWSAAREQFAPLAAGAQTHSDLYAIITLMVGELRASHLGLSFSGGYTRSDGYIGLLFDRAKQTATGRLRVAAIVPDSPAALATFAHPQTEGDGIQVGDELLAVDGVAVGAATSLDRLLQRTVGRRVLLRIGPKDGGEPRELAVRPVDAAQYDSLRYRAWVYANESYVHRISGGRLLAFVSTARGVG